MKYFTWANKKLELHCEPISSALGEGKGAKRIKSYGGVIWGSWGKNFFCIYKISIGIFRPPKLRVCLCESRHLCSFQEKSGMTALKSCLRNLSTVVMLTQKLLEPLLQLWGSLQALHKHLGDPSDACANNRTL